MTVQRLRRPTTPYLLACVLALAACDKSSAEDPAAKAQAKADADAKAEAEEEARIERLVAEKRAREKAEHDKTYGGMVERFVKEPEALPKDLDAACTELIENYSDWIKAVYFDDDRAQLEFFDHKKKNLGVVKGKCAKVGNIAAAACMTGVIKGVSADDVSEADRKLIQAEPDYLFDECVAKFAPDNQ
ncbi:hypothetical protein G6O69_24010 [Pseudenhygromyxa sp. WMMC2535]|uniref:hypothetical protein n=1 Tax=Pseudenhygromyxa sp. WMMC2535 TaxID=2712867 RepID=UPI0015579C39|nr:hypothetical protein [Pseudenhygromyxa sp. WMMC2535]NVB40926.1 hypothetical protein [Pseudenhygromyxa sp. WMMC2535]